MKLAKGAAARKWLAADPDERSTFEIASAVIDAACKLRDYDYNTDDPGPYLDALDSAVDAWRRRLRERAQS